MWEWTPPSETYRRVTAQHKRKIVRRNGITYKTEEVKAAVGGLGVLAALDDDLVLVELTLLDGDVDFHDVLPDDTAGTDVEMAG